MQIRRATEEDLEAILALNASIQQQHAEALPKVFRPISRSHQTVETFRGFFNNPTSLMLLAEGTEPAGYLWAQFQSRPANWAFMELQTMYIQHTVVAPKFRRQGVGTLLMSTALEAAKAKGIERVELDVWSFNSEAKHFYAKHGFKTFNEKLALTIDGN
jgi:ribosomal protein S18 acetylase RimI-like enzyme